MNWIKASKCLTNFNGCRQTCIVGNFEYGIFKEKYGSLRWNYRKRPVDEHGYANEGWGYPLTQTDTKKETLEICEKRLNGDK